MFQQNKITMLQKNLQCRRQNNFFIVSANYVTSRLLRDTDIISCMPNQK